VTEHAAAVLRLHGAGDGSVMAYCGVCRNPLPHLPRPATLEAVLAAWRSHLLDVAPERTELTRG
jgi:hypothetical protein